MLIRGLGRVSLVLTGAAALAIVAVPIPAVADPEQPKPLPTAGYVGCDDYYISQADIDAASTNSGTTGATVGNYSYQLTDSGLAFAGDGSDAKVRLMLPYRGTLNDVGNGTASIDYTYQAAAGSPADVEPPTIAFANGTVGGQTTGDLYSELNYGQYYTGPSSQPGQPIGANDSGLATAAVGEEVTSGQLNFATLWPSEFDAALTPSWTGTSPVGGTTIGGSIADWAGQFPDQAVATAGLVMDSSSGSFVVHSFTLGCTTYHFGPYTATVTPSSASVSGQSGVAITPITMTTGGGVAGARTFTSTDLPAGLSIDPTTGTISGTPTNPGTATATVTATDPLGTIATTTVTFSIMAGPLTVSLSQASTSGTVGVPVSVTVTAHGGTPPYTYSATDLPAGVSIDSATGRISGTPTMAGSGTATITVRDDAGASETTEWNYTITAATTPTTSTPSTPMTTNPSMPTELGDTGTDSATPTMLAALFVITGAGILLARRRALHG